MARKTKKKSGLTVNFKGVDTSGGRRRIPEDEYLMEVLSAEEAESSGGNEMVKWTCAVAEGQYKGTKFYLYTTLNEEALWKLHAFLTALGVEVPDDELELELEEYEGETFIGVVEDDTYDGKKVSRLVDFYSVEGDADDGGKKNKSSKDDDEDEDEKPSRKSRRSKDDDEDDKPARGKKSKKSKEPEKVATDDVQGMDEDELGDLVEKYELDLDLDDYKTLRKKQAAVIDALEAADLIEDESAGDEEEEEDERPSRAKKSSKKDADEDEDSPAAKRKARREARKNRK